MRFSQLKTLLRKAHVDDINTLTFDDPEIFRYPIAYVIEPDWWALSDSEAAAMRTYMDCWQSGCLHTARRDCTLFPGDVSLSEMAVCSVFSRAT